MRKASELLLKLEIPRLHNVGYTALGWHNELDRIQAAWGLQSWERPRDGLSFYPDGMGMPYFLENIPVEETPLFLMYSSPYS